MGREGTTGVRAVSNSTIEISFPYKGKRCRERLRLKPTPANMKRAARHRAAIMDAIDKGTFDYAETFPESPRAKEFARMPGDAFARGYLSNWLNDKKTWTFLAGEHVFHNPRTNEPWTGDQPIRKTLWTPALKKAGVLYRNPYQTRHTYASMMLSSGEHPMWVAKQMGHADWTMIARRYGKWMPDADPECGNRAVGLYAQPEDQQRKKGNSQ
ncbi:DUF3596 domain-containing protein [Salinisphaera sp. G21_0]|uniref:Arm DNA-binding domain-containing protein n=1 Tax=Salinisphaera sp. G21_0 TaxID=2821094 RepID=UPI001ADA7517|nr:DUF3596 domain-containing protein [Salinisphaera sp. G21_0]MBO9483572.1 DUF3596 domain-containing protein [Salinisphaera sp. G21_0]